MTTSFAVPHDEHMAMTLSRQRKAFLDGGMVGLRERKDRLKRLRAAALASRPALESAIGADFGNRSRHETAIMELMASVQSIDYLLRKLRRFMKPERRHVGLSYRTGRAWVEYQPLGVVGIMAPWNYPFSLTIVPLATALAAGNRAMIKPSELTPRTSEVIRQMLASTFSVDEVAVVLGGPETGAAFSALAFDHLLFTGSTEVGRKVMRAASANLVPVTLELGGKSPAVIARGQAGARTMNSLLAAFYPHGPAHPDYTSIISDRHHERLKRLLADARSKGARVIEVGNCPESASARIRTLAPTLVVGVSDEMALMDEEIFGPILPVRTYRDMAEVVAYINARPRPLALYYFGPDDADRRLLLTRTTSGNVGINNTLMHVAQDDLPFGGVGPSGMGAYHGIEGFRAMSHAKGVYLQGKWSLPRLLHAPFGRFADLVLAFALGPTDRR